jgi:hypothetical protein
MFILKLNCSICLVSWIWCSDGFIRL